MKKKLLFHLAKWKNVYFIRGFATRAICIFHFTRYNSYSWQKMNFLYLLDNPIQILCIVTFIGRCMSLFVFSSSWCNWKAMIYVCGFLGASSLLCLYSATLSVLYIAWTTKQVTEYVWPCFIRISKAILGLNESRRHMEMMGAKLCLFGHQPKNGLHTDFLWWRGIERLESGLLFWNDCFWDADTEIKWNN